MPCNKKLEKPKQVYKNAYQKKGLANKKSLRI